MIETISKAIFTIAMLTIAFIVTQPIVDLVIRRIVNRFWGKFQCYNCRKKVYLIYRGKVDIGCECHGPKHYYQCPECSEMYDFKQKL